MSKSSYSVEEKYEILNAIEDHYSLNELEPKYNVVNARIKLTVFASTHYLSNSVTPLYPLYDF